MFHLAVFTDEVSQDLEKAIKLALDFCLEGVEIRSVWDTSPQNLSDAQVADIKRLLEAHNLKTCCIAAPFLKCTIFNQAEYAEHFEILRRCISVGKRLGTKLMRGFTCWKTEDTPEVWAEVERLYRQALPILESEDAIIAIENEFVTSAATAALTEKFLRKLNSPRLRAVWDPANEVHAAEGEVPYPNGYNRLKPFIAHVHCKDAARDGAGEARITRVGDGEIDWQGQLKALADDGYNGWVSLETHWRMEEKDLSEEQVRLPGGGAFSEAGEMASGQCLFALQKLMPGKTS